MSMDALTSECRECGGTIWHDDGTSSEDCDDIPQNGQCDGCATDEADAIAVRDAKLSAKADARGWK